MIWKIISLIFTLTTAAEDCDKLINVVTGEVLCVNEGTVPLTDDAAFERGKSANDEKSLKWKVTKYCNYLELSEFPGRIEKPNMDLLPSCWVFWVGPQVTYQFTVALNITTPKVNPDMENLACGMRQQTIVVSRQHLKNITTGDVEKYLKNYVGWDGKGAMFPSKGITDTVITGCHNSMPLYIREVSEPYITVMWEGQSLDSVYAGSQTWTIDYVLDQNECEDGIGKTNCTANADCINTIGSFYCKCTAPYEGDGYEACLNPTDYIQMAELQLELEEADRRITALEAKWNETTIFFAKSDNETNTLLQDSLTDLAKQNLELEIFTDMIMAEVEAMDKEIEERTVGLDEMVIRLDNMVTNFEVSTTSYVETFQQRYTDSKQERELVRSMNLLTFSQLMNNVGNRSIEFEQLYIAGMENTETLVGELANIQRNPSRQRNAETFESTIENYETELSQQKMTAMNELAKTMFLIPDVKVSIDQASAYANEEIDYFNSLHSSFTAYRVTDLRAPSLGNILTVPFPNVMLDTKKHFNPVIGVFSAKLEGDYFFTMTMKVSKHGPVYIYMAVNNVETNIQIRLDSVTRVGTDMLQASGILSLALDDEVSVKLKTNGLSSTNGECTFSGHLINPTYDFVPVNPKPTFGRTYTMKRSGGPLDTSIRTSGYRVRKSSTED